MITYKRYEKSGPPLVVEMATVALSLRDMLPALNNEKRKKILIRLAMLTPPHQ